MGAVKLAFLSAPSGKAPLNYSILFVLFVTTKRQFRHPWKQTLTRGDRLSRQAAMLKTWSQQSTTRMDYNSKIGIGFIITLCVGYICKYK